VKLPLAVRGQSRRPGGPRCHGRPARSMFTIADERVPRQGETCGGPVEPDGIRKTQGVRQNSAASRSSPFSANVIKFNPGDKIRLSRIRVLVHLFRSRPPAATERLKKNNQI